MYDIGIDFGGTSVTIGLVRGIYLEDSIMIPTDLEKGPEKIVDDIAKTTRQLLFRNVISIENVHSVGVGVPGTANLGSGVVEYANNIGFHDTPFCKMLEAALEKEVFFDNDANAAALGEYLIEDSHAKSFILVTLGTGIGCGMIFNGGIYRGVNYAAGEIGHMTIRYDGKKCNCGRRGCFEAYASASALVEQAREAMKEDQDSFLWKTCKHQLEELNGIAFFQAVARNDATALRVRDQYVEYVAEGLANLINLMQPEELRLGGGISAAGEFYLPQVKERVSELIYSKDSKVNTNIQLARAYNDAGVIGAALLNSPLGNGHRRAREGEVE